MTNLELALILITSVVLPWLIFVTKAILSIRTTQSRMLENIIWIRKEHEPEAGVQSWKNPGLVEAVNKLGVHLDRFGDRFEALLDDIRTAVQQQQR